MKICFTVDSMRSGGTERVVSVLANEFAKQGHDVSIIMVSSLQNETFFVLENVQLICLMDGFTKKVNALKRLMLLKKTLRHLKPDIVIACLPHIIAYTYFAVKNSGAKLIVSERNDPSKLSFKYKIILRYIFKHSSGNVFQTDMCRNWYGKNTAKLIDVIPNPINPKIAFKQVDNRNDVIVSVGRLVEQKNYPLLLDSFKRFVSEKQNQNYKLHIYGRGYLLDRLERYCKHIGIEANVSFMGTQEDWIGKEISSKMFILSSNFEGMPNSLLEAMASGIPCISTNCPIGGPSQLIQDGVNGLLVPVGDSNALYKAMIRLANEKLSNSISEANKFMYKEFDGALIANRWISFISKVIK